MNDRVAKTYKVLCKSKRRAAFEKTGGICAYCGCRLDFEDVRTWVTEHIVSRAAGGTNDDGNLVAACGNCNRRKRSHRPEEFRVRIKERAAEKVEEAWRILFPYAHSDQVATAFGKFNEVMEAIDRTDIVFAREDLLDAE